MSDQPSVRLNKVLRELNISLDRAVEFLNQKDIEVDARPTTKIPIEVYNTLLDEFETDKSKKVASHEVSEEKRKEKENLRVIQEKKEQERIDQIAQREALKTNRVALEKPKTLGKIDLDLLNNRPKPPKSESTFKDKLNSEKKEIKAVEAEKTKLKVEKTQEKKAPQQLAAESTDGQVDEETLKTQYTKLSGPKKTGQKINLDEVNQKEKTVEDARKPVSYTHLRAHET